MSQRLTNRMRERITNALAARTFQPLEEAWNNEANDLFMRIHKVAWGEHYEAISRMPISMFNSSLYTIVRTKDGNGVSEVRLYGKYPVAMPFDFPWAINAFCDSNCRVSRAIAADEQLRTDLHAFLRKKLKLESDKAAARSEIEAVLYSITTVKKLLAVWPELASVPGLDLEPEATAGQQMVVSLAELNKTLGLPAETAAA